HSAQYIHLQSTYFSLHALNALGAHAPHTLRWVEPLLDTSKMRAWLDAGPWQNPWLHSNNVMFLLTFMERYHQQTGSARALGGMDSVLEYLDQRQDAVSGLWQPTGRIDMHDAVYASYHCFPYYFWRGRQPRHVNRIIDTTLSIQHADGLFGKRVG